MKLTKKTKKQIVSLLIALVISGLGFLSEHNQQTRQTLGTVTPGNYVVTEFSDGDTITVSMDGQTEKIRMIGVDTPETQDPRKSVQCFGKAASAFTQNLIGNQHVRLETDPESTNRDRYNRLLRYVYLPDGRLVQAEIIKEGYGFAYTSFPFAKSEEFKRYETEARQAGKGLWSSCEPTTNEYGGYTSNAE